jgi:hypothetical protein
MDPQFDAAANSNCMAVNGAKSYASVITGSVGFSPGVGD